MTEERCPHCGGGRTARVWPSATEETAPRLYRQRYCLDCFRPFVVPFGPDQPAPPEEPDPTTPSPPDLPLTFAAFAAANRARCESALGFNHRIESWSLSDWMMAVVGELGEAANAAKKLNRIRDGIPGNTLTEAELRARLRREVADTFIYLDLLAQAAGFRLEDAVREAWDAKSAEIGYPGRLTGPSGPSPEDP